MITTEELISRVAPKIGVFGMTYYFTPETVARGSEFGLDMLTWYVIGRGGVLGNADPTAVAAAFGYFNPDTIAAAWNAGCEKIEPRRAGAEYLRCAAEFGRAKLSAVPNIDRLAAALLQVQQAADPQGLSLYAAYAPEPIVDDAPGRTMQLCTKLRELRGSAHLLAIRAVGLEPRIAHFIARPEMYAMFGWDDANPPQVTEQHHELRAEAEALTDRLMAPAFDVLDEQSREDLVDGLRAVKTALDA